VRDTAARALCLVAAVLAVVARPAATGTGWTRVESPHFVVSGEVSDRDVRQVAFQLETFREVFSRVIPGARERSLLPPFVVVFGSERSFAPYKPVFDGLAAPVGGYVVREPLAPCMALRLDGSDEATRTVFHEYAHVLFDPSAAPLWLSEGVADYYSTTVVLRDRQHVEVGREIPAHVMRARRAWLPLRQILTTSRASKIWATDAGQSFYAESWLLVHYLVRGTPERGAQIPRLIARLARGDDEQEVFRQEIGQPARVEAELKRYLATGVAPSEVIALPAQIGMKAAKEHAMTPAEVEATLGRLSSQLQRDDEALGRLQAALALDPELAEAHMALGLLLLRQGRFAEAVDPFRHANARDPDNLLVAYNFALVALRAEDEGEAAPLERAFGALQRVVRPDSPEPLAVLGTVAGRLGRLGEAEDLLRRAAELAPSRFPTQFELANVCLRVGKFDEARAILDKLAVRADGSVREALDQRRGWLAMAEARASVRAELAAAAGLARPGPDAAIARTGSFPVPPEFRAPRPGEQRAVALFDAVECAPQGLVFRATTRSGPIRLAAGNLAGVHVASARQGATSPLSCGPRGNREAVYVTWRANRELVAIEFLPEDLAPAPAGR
jgi:Flp pilus assembly protein TadD